MNVYLGLIIVWLAGFVTGLRVGIVMQDLKPAKQRTKVSDLYPKKPGGDDAA